MTTRADLDSGVALLNSMLPDAVPKVSLVLRRVNQRKVVYSLHTNDGTPASMEVEGAGPMQAVVLSIAKFAAHMQGALKYANST